MLETHWEQGSEKRKKLPPPHLLKEKTRLIKAHRECMLSPHIGCMKFPFSKPFVTIFGLG
jgi:hypothetical protein